MDVIIYITVKKIQNIFSVELLNYVHHLAC